MMQQMSVSETGAIGASMDFWRQMVAFKSEIGANPGLRQLFKRESIKALQQCKEQADETVLKISAELLATYLDQLPSDQHDLLLKTILKLDDDDDDDDEDEVAWGFTTVNAIANVNVGVNVNVGLTVNVAAITNVFGPSIAEIEDPGDDGSASAATWSDISVRIASICLDSEQLNSLTDRLQKLHLGPSRQKHLFKMALARPFEILSEERRDNASWRTVRYAYKDVHFFLEGFMENGVIRISDGGIKTSQ